jgi:hypothetical protein
MNPSTRDIWVQLVTESVPIISNRAAELLYYRAATAWGMGQQFTVPNGTGGRVDLTNLFEQCKLIAILKGDQDV